MREYPMSIMEMFLNGLRPEGRGRLNKKYLETCRDIHPIETGLVQQVEVINPLANLTITWPFPQLFRGAAVTLLADRTALYSVTEGTPWTKTAITTYNQVTEATKAITAGGAWNFIDFYNTWVLLNGTCAVYKMNWEGMTGGTNLVFVNDEVGVGAGCTFKGRMVLGGFSNGFFSDDWKAILEPMAAELDSGLSTALELGSNFIWWSAAGGGNLAWPLIPPAAMYGWLNTHTVEQPLFLDYMKRGDSGFMPVPFQGSILALRKLGNGLMIFSQNGVVFANSYLQPAVTFGIRPLVTTGLLGRGAVGGDDQGLVFLDQSGALWQARPTDGGAQVERLGFTEFFDDYLAQTFVISMDPLERIFYISCATASFMLQGGKLSTLTQKVTSAEFAAGGVVGVGTGTATTFEVLSGPLNMNSVEQKTIHTVKVSYDDITDLQVRVLYRYDHGAWSTTDWYGVNAEGVATVIVAGTDFKVGIKGTLGGDSEITDVQVSWKNTDKRSQRAANANSTSA